MGTEAGLPGGAAPLVLNGVALVADLTGALWWPERRTLVVADLHLEKGSRFAARGQPLPPYDTGATLARLRRAIARFDPRCVVCLGDSFDDAGGPGRLSTVDATALAALMAGREWIWVAGNHDPGPGWGEGSDRDEVVIGPLVLRHAAVPAASGRALGEISGHFHPVAILRLRGRRLRGRCFVSDGNRLILPALGAYAGGMSIGEPALAGLFDREMTAVFIGRERLYSLRFSPGRAGGADHIAVAERS